MKKLYLLGAALLSMTAITQATMLTVFNNTGSAIKMWVGGHAQFGHEGYPVTIKKGGGHRFMSLGNLGNPVGLVFADELKRAKPRMHFTINYVAPAIDPLFLGIRGISIERSDINTYVNPIDKKTTKGIPRIIQTWPQKWFKPFYVGDFKGKVVKPTKLK